MVRRPTCRTPPLEDGGRRDGRRDRHRRLHEPRAGARTAGRQAHRHLGVRLRPLRDVDRTRARLRARRSRTRSRRFSSASRTGRRCPARRPRPIRRLLLRCLAKDPKKRLRDIGDVRIEIDAIDEVLPGTPATSSAARSCHESHDVAAVGRARGDACRGRGRVGRADARRRRWRTRSPTPRSRASRTGRARKSTPKSRPTAGSSPSSPTRPDELDVWVSQAGHREIRQPHARPPADVDARESPAKPRVFGRRVGDLVQPYRQSRARKSAHAADRRHASTVPGRRLLHSILVARQRPSRLHRLRRPRRSVVPRRPHGGGRPSHRRARATARKRSSGKACTHTIRSGHRTATGSTSSTGREAAGEMDVWRMQPSGESPERLTHHQRPREFSDADRFAHAALRGARGRLVGTLAVGARRGEQELTRRVTVGLEQYTSVSASRDGRRVVATVANPTASLWRVPLLDRLVEDRDAQPYPVPTERALAPRFGGTSLFYLSLSRAGPATGSGGFRTIRRSKCGRGPTAYCPSRPPRRRTAAAWRSSSDSKGNGTSPSCRQTAPTHEPWLRPSTSKAWMGQGAADWSPDGDVDRHGWRRRARAGLVQDPGGRRRARAARRGGGRQSGLVAER